jgi:hypothetical protein
MAYIKSNISTKLRCRLAGVPGFSWGSVFVLLPGLALIQPKIASGFSTGKFLTDPYILNYTVMYDMCRNSTEFHSS